jgi:hypothetical protein
MNTNAKLHCFSALLLAAGATYKAEWDDGRRIAVACPQLAR